MQDFKKLQVWQKAHSFTVNLYRLTSSFPDEEKYGLTNQLLTAIRQPLAGGALQRTDVLRFR